MRRTEQQEIVRRAGVGPHHRHFLLGFPRVLARCGFAWISCCGWNWRGDSARAKATLCQVRAHVPFISSSGHGNGRRLV